MAITEQSRNDLYQGLAEALGKQRATTLMEHLPPRGWADVATKQDLQQAVGDLRSDMDVRFAEVRAEFAEVRTETREQFAGVAVQFAELRTELHRTLRLHTLAMMAMMLTLLGLVNGLFRLTS